MTYTARELLANGVPKDAVAWRIWRRQRGLRTVDVATMLGISLSALHRIELGKQHPWPATLERLRRFVECWDKVPERRRALIAAARELRGKFGEVGREYR